MGYFGKLEEKITATKLRKKGLSYKQIMKKVHVSKDTISRWCKDIILTPEQMEELLKRKLVGAEKGRLIWAGKLKIRRVEEIKEFNSKGKKAVGRLSDRDMFLIGISLYAAEGSKRNYAIQFANTDPRMIVFMMNWFRKFCEVPESKFRGSIWIHDDLDVKEATKFWSELTGIPGNQFHKAYLVKNKANSRKIRKNKHKYGVFSIRVSDAKKQRMILGWIYGVFGG